MCLPLRLLGRLRRSNRKTWTIPQQRIDLQRLVNGPELRLEATAAIGKDLMLTPAKGDNVDVVGDPPGRGDIGTTENVETSNAGMKR